MLKEEVLKLKKIVFAFPYKLKSGLYYFDVIIEDSEGIRKFRKIEKIKV